MSWLVPLQCKLHHSVEFQYANITIIDEYNMLLATKEGKLYSAKLDEFLKSNRSEDTPVEFSLITSCSKYLYINGIVFFIKEGDIFKASLAQLLKNQFFLIEHATNMVLIFDRVFRISDEQGILENIALNDTTIKSNAEYLFIQQTDSILIKNKDLFDVKTLSLDGIQDFYLIADILLVSLYDPKNGLVLKYAPFSTLLSSNEWSILDDELFDESVVPPVHVITYKSIHKHHLISIGRNSCGDVNFFELDVVTNKIEMLKINEQNLVTTPLDLDGLPLGCNFMQISLFPTISIQSLTPDIDPDDFEPQPIFILLSKTTLTTFYLINKNAKSCPEMIKIKKLDSLPDVVQITKPDSPVKPQNVNKSLSPVKPTSPVKPLFPPMDLPIPEPIHTPAEPTINNMSSIPNNEYTPLIKSLIDDFNSDLSSISNIPAKRFEPFNNLPSLQKTVNKQYASLKSLQTHVSLQLDQLLISKQQKQRIQQYENARFHKQPTTNLSDVLHEELIDKIDSLQLDLMDLEDNESTSVDPLDVQSLISTTRTVSVTVGNQIEQLASKIKNLNVKVEPHLVHPKRTIKPIKNMTMTRSIYSPSKPKTPSSIPTDAAMKMTELLTPEPTSPLANKEKKLRFAKKDEPQEPFKAAFEFKKEPEKPKSIQPPKNLIQMSLNTPPKTAEQPPTPVVTAPTPVVEKTPVKPILKQPKPIEKEEPKPVVEVPATDMQDSMETEDKQEPVNPIKSSFSTPQPRQNNSIGPTFGNTANLGFTSPGFGSPSTLGFTNTVAPAPTTFGSGGGGFAKYSNPQPGFGQQPQSSGFPQPPQQSSGFPQPQSTGFGQGQQSGGFGQQPAFGQPQQQSSGFGQPQQGGSDIFGNSQTNQP